MDSSFKMALILVATGARSLSVRFSTQKNTDEISLSKPVLGPGTKQNNVGMQSVQSTSVHTTTPKLTQHGAWKWYALRKSLNHVSSLQLPSVQAVKAGFTSKARPGCKTTVAAARRRAEDDRTRGSPYVLCPQLHSVQVLLRDAMGWYRRPATIYFCCRPFNGQGAELDNLSMQIVRSTPVYTPVSRQAAAQRLFDVYRRLRTDFRYGNPGTDLRYDDFIKAKDYDEQNISVIRAYTAKMTQHGDRDRGWLSPSAVLQVIFSCTPFKFFFEMASLDPGVW
ncbi:hypothetical protein C8R44DRAFT_741497 [Mycena epipterygia]|nr:hypothetical protein C8R44DRAFT_741497 [Mycena epipterygia]